MKYVSIAIALIAMSSVSACKSTQSDSSGAKTTKEVVSYQVIYDKSTGHLPNDSYMKLYKPENGVINNYNDYTQLFKKHTNQSDLQPIDFKKQQLVYQTLGWQSHGGEKITVKQIKDLGASVSVELQHIGAGCIVTTVMDYPAIFVAVNTTKPINITLLKTPKGSCNVN